MEYLDRECGKYLATKLKSYVDFDSNSKQMVLVLKKLVDCLEKCLIYGHIRRVAD